MNIKLERIDFVHVNNKEYRTYEFTCNGENVEIEVKEKGVYLKYIQGEIEVKELNEMFIKVLEMEKKINV